MPRFHATVLGPLLALLACASPGATSAPSTPTAVRARFAPPQGDAVFERAVRAVALAGYRLRACDPQRRRLETTRVEFDAPCGRTTCLARQSVEVVLGYRQARVTVSRELFDGGWRVWHSEHVQGSQEAAHALLAEIMAESAPPVARQGISRRSSARSASADPCAAVFGETTTRVARADLAP